MKKLHSIILVTILLHFSNVADAQRKKEKNKITPENSAKNDEEARAKEEKQAKYVASRDHHLDVQDKATRKRMKKTKKKAQKHSWGKDVPWYKRWFRRDNF